LISVLLTGPVGSGKTTVCRELFDIARSAGRKVGGVSIEKWPDDSGQAEILALRDLTTGNWCELARPAGGSEPPEGWFVQGRWCFHREAFVWANMLLAKPSPVDLMIIDEIGPLEMEGEGFAPAAWSARAPRMLYVARSGLAKALRPNLKRPELKIMELTEDNRDGLPKKLAAIFEIYT